MLSAELITGLEHYQIGSKVNALRSAKDLSLVQLAAHTGMSPAMLSKIERGNLFPTLPTLLRIAMVFGVGLDHFFADAAPKLGVVRRKERVRLPERMGDKNPPYFFENLDFPVTDRKMDAYYAEFPAGARSSDPHAHSGAEFIYVLSGHLAVRVVGQETVLAAGDSMYFESNNPHSYRCDGNVDCKSIVVIVP